MAKHGYTKSSPCEPDSPGELTKALISLLGSAFVLRICIKHVILQNSGAKRGFKLRRRVN